MANFTRFGLDKALPMWYNKSAGRYRPGEGTHHKKQTNDRKGNGIPRRRHKKRGRHPLEKHGKPNQPKEVPYAPPKTVGVRDEAGNRYEATYPKRARGLVKHGRARFTDESQTEIILTCPPNQKLILEDHTMTEQVSNFPMCW